MKVIVAGSRTITDFRMVSAILVEKLPKFETDYDEIVSGAARGVDTLAVEFAKLWEIPYKTFPANWNKFGKAAGHIRNGEMADYADGLILIWDGLSRGSSDMLNQAKKKGLKIENVIV